MAFDALRPIFDRIDGRIGLLQGGREGRWNAESIKCKPAHTHTHSDCELEVCLVVDQNRSAGELRRMRNRTITSAHGRNQRDASH